MAVRTQHADAKCPFRPHISEASRHLLAGNADLVGETQEERLHRLAVQDVKRREHMKSALSEFHSRDCTFRPEINPVSLALLAKADATKASEGQTTTPRSRRERSRERSRERHQTSRSGGDVPQKQQEEECSFQPQLDSRSASRFAHVKPRYSANGTEVMETVRQDMERRALAAAERRRAVEEAEQASCTFMPVTSRPYQEPQRPVVVSGLDRFFELRGLAQKNRQEQQEREAKVFRPEGIRQKQPGVTICEPFVLSIGNKDTVPKKRGSKQLPDECSFAPVTNESANRDAVRRLLGGSARR